MHTNRPRTDYYFLHERSLKTNQHFNIGSAKPNMRNASVTISVIILINNQKLHIKMMQISAPAWLVSHGKFVLKAILVGEQSFQNS